MRKRAQKTKELRTLIEAAGLQQFFDMNVPPESFNTIQKARLFITDALWDRAAWANTTDRAEAQRVAQADGVAD